MMRGRFGAWVRAQVEDGAFETKADITTFVLITVLTATVMATATYLMVAAVLAYFEMLPYPFVSALGFGGPTTVLIAASVTALLAWLIGTAIHELSVSRAEFERLSRTDSLSGLLNRRAFTEALAQEAGAGFFVLFDVDRFKNVNDRYGHAAGDEVIIAVSQELQRVFQVPHLVGRFGGEEFSVFIQGEDIEDCRLLVEELRRSVASRTVQAGKADVSVTISAGIADRDAHRTLDALFEAADRALYLAKSLGRDRAIHEAQSDELLAPSRRAAAGGRRH
jgi:diguanylate cyclase (GGDEF)-like protein